MFEQVLECQQIVKLKWPNCYLKALITQIT